MKVSVIVLCHNNYHIDKVVDVIEKQLNSNDELFVVDDHSNEDVRNLLKKYCGTAIDILTPKTNGNRAANRNLAADKATGDLLIFVDGDVLLDDVAIELIRNFDYKGISGLCGSVAAMGMTPETIAVTTHNYFDALDIGSSSFEFWHKLFPDFRNKNLLPWNRFYTALAVIPREAFYQSGKFDEHFSGWGGEDIDIGYRLSKIGLLKISSAIRGVHIPHSRNITQEENNGRKNMYLMLKKYRNRDMEELLSFALTPYVTNAIDEVLMTLSVFSDSNITLPSLPGILTYWPVSKENPSGKIVYYDNEYIKQEDFLGLALPFFTAHFEKVVTTTNIFDYPEGMATRIMQELSRVSKEFMVIKVPSRNIKWREIEERFRYVFCYYKIYRFADSYQDFLIEDHKTHYIIKYNNFAEITKGETLNYENS